MRLRHSVLVVFTVRPYGDEDFFQLARVYRSAFAEPPWDEYKKCGSCDEAYSRQDVEAVSEADSCKSCDVPLKLVDYWSYQDIRADIDNAKGQPGSIIDIACGSNDLLGFSYGYRISISEYPFLEGLVNPDALYLDDIAVSGQARRLGIGSLLCTEFLQKAKDNRRPQVVLRTDQRNAASMGLFQKEGFTPILDGQGGMPIIDPNYDERVWLVQDIGDAT